MKTLKNFIKQREKREIIMVQTIIVSLICSIFASIIKGFDFVQFVMYFAICYVFTYFSSYLIYYLIDVLYSSYKSILHKMDIIRYNKVTKNGFMAEFNKLQWRPGKGPKEMKDYQYAKWGRYKLEVSLHTFEPSPYRDNGRKAWISRVWENGFCIGDGEWVYIGTTSDPETQSKKNVLEKAFIEYIIEITGKTHDWFDIFKKIYPEKQ